jgi:hypothetical protein
VPVLGQAEFGHGGFDVNRRKVAGRGELDAFGTDAVKQPGIRADHPGRGRHVDQHRLQDPAVNDEAQEVDLRERVTERGNQILDLRRELRTHAAEFFRHGGLVVWSRRRAASTMLTSSSSGSDATSRRPGRSARRASGRRQHVRRLESLR